jgi:hypothetical protein
MKSISLFIFPALLVGITLGACSPGEQKKDLVKLNEMNLICDSTSKFVLFEKINAVVISKEYFPDKKGIRSHTKPAGIDFLFVALTDHFDGYFYRRETSIAIDEGLFSNTSINVEMCDYTVKIEKQIATHGIYSKEDNFAVFGSVRGDTIRETVLGAEDVKEISFENLEGYKVDATIEYVYCVSLTDSNNVLKSDTIRFQFPATVILSPTNLNR